MERIFTACENRCDLISALISVLFPFLFLLFFLQGAGVVEFLWNVLLPVFLLYAYLAITIRKKRE